MEFQLSSFLSVIASLVIIELLLSVDNALVNASLARNLPKELQPKAIRIGIIFGAVFRVLALLGATIIIQNVWIRAIGALYLIYLAMAHLGLDEHDNNGKKKKAKTFKAVIVQIALADLVFGIDNVITAVGLSDNFVYVVTGVLIGIAGMIFLAPKMLRLIDFIPSLASTAYVIVGLIGTIMLVEDFAHIHIVEWQKFLLILVVMLFTFVYDRSPVLKKFFGPSFGVFKKIFGFIAGGVQAFVSTLLVTTTKPTPTKPEK